jgi:hypothetical protein
MLSLFADDTAILASGHYPRFAMQELHHTKLLEQKLTKWRVRINLDETKATFFTRRSHRRLPELYSKYLGITSDRNYFGMDI